MVDALVTPSPLSVVRSAGPAQPAEPLEALGDRICAGAVQLAAATASWLRLVAEFDQREGWRGIGITSCAHWLAWRCALTPGTARQHVRVARALRALPLTSAAFSAGELSYSKVRALTRVAEPGTEAELVEFARHATASQVERTVRAWRRADDVDAGRVADRRRFSWWTEDDGMISVQVRMEAEHGAEFLAAIESLAERDARRERAARTRATAAGGFVPPGSDTGPETADDGTTGDGAVADASVPEEHAPGDPAIENVAEPLAVSTERRCRAMTRLAAAAADADRRAGDPPRREVVVVVDATVLADDEAAGRAALAGGPALTPAQARRLACDAAVTAIVTDGPEVLAQGRSRRYATRAQRRALLLRDGGCARPGCEETRPERLHAHHLRHWLHGGRTDVSNMVLLCDVDHGLVHDHDLALSRAGGRLVAVAPDGGRPWEDTGGRFRGTAADGLSSLLPGTHRLPAALPSDGERMDLQHVVWALMAHRDVVRRRAA
ncbi:HNH endonuclease signature motif containing protein [Modestobacter italicus]|uniref:HNH endonuclease signature motif containing protein n=1 Tax=Modestobacter italicus (strain DSM 44449 / CECT 9708 / BC 501) TaxID=2732864 RepID=UPI001C953994|nr:HNH endonuclease signature motif containing protein [Modestobacter italicus]